MFINHRQEQWPEWLGTAEFAYNKIKKIVSLNAIELELLSTVKIHPVVNVSRICKYVGQVEGQRKEQPAPVIIEGEEK